MKTAFRAKVAGARDSISAEDYNALLRGALELMIYMGAGEVELLELNDSEEYEHMGYLQLVGV